MRNNIGKLYVNRTLGPGEVGRLKLKISQELKLRTIDIESNDDGEYLVTTNDQSVIDFFVDDENNLHPVKLKPHNRKMEPDMKGNLLVGAPIYL